MKRNILIKVATKLVHDGLVKNDMVETYTINTRTYEIESDRVENLHFKNYAKTLKEAFVLIENHLSGKPAFEWVRDYDETCALIEKLQNEGKY